MRVASGAHQLSHLVFSCKRRMGLALFILILLQATLGTFAHHTPLAPSSSPFSRPPTLSLSKSPLRLAHPALGLATAALGLAQLQTGIALWNYESKFNGTMGYSHAVLWSVAGVAMAAYFAGWVWEVVGRGRGGATRSGGGVAGEGSEAEKWGTPNSGSGANGGRQSE